ncbi:MAG TPA: transketolase [Polyangia bacterium]
MTRTATPTSPPLDPRRVARGIRRRVLGHVVAHGGGYLSQACSAAEILATLYARVLRLGPSLGPARPAPFTGVPGPGRPTRTGAAYHGARAPDLDRLFFSPAHYALVLYAALVEVGRLDAEALDDFNRDGSTVELIAAEHSPGVEAMPGSLPQALSQAGGVALARRLRGEAGRTFVFMSDGELQEGQAWEAMAALAFHGLGGVALYVDVNGQQCDGRTEAVISAEPLAARLRAFGAVVHEVDGHDPDALAAPAAAPPGRAPLVVLAHTDPCRGCALLADRAPRLHYLRFRDDEERAAYAALLADEGWGEA